MTIDVTAQLVEDAVQINRAYGTLERSRQHDFNIFSLLRQEDDEVYLHSRFIGELLDPLGTHRMGTLFLDLFLEQVNIEGFDLTSVNVQREYHNIDIFLTNGKRAMVIENKIYAPDQPQQLQRYYRMLKKEGFKHINIIYLTLYGDDPGAESMGNLDSAIVTPISYQIDVRDWLVNCLESVKPYPVITQTIVQYQYLVEKLTGQAQGRQLMDVKALLSDAEHVTAAITISQALLAVKIDLQYKFWVSLEEKLTAVDYEITEYWKYSRRSVEAYYTKGVRRYGILINLPELMDQEIVAFFIGVSHRIYYGFIPLEGGSPVNMSNDPGFTLLSDILKASDETWSSSPSMLGWRPTQQNLDFFTFNTPDTLALINPGCLSRSLDVLVEEIAGAIDAFYTGCEDDPRLSEAPAW